ncbi:BTAD domain-containing putative transcriptional regulator [Amycolatopsis sp. NPDC049868]|uniref:AfsR/SARP family transcriptional regulator n=1 Tax=Amycolatopsis sp. NPDC049868 TaxID=3363934 RepID=UPI00379BB8E5
MSTESPSAPLGVLGPMSVGSFIDDRAIRASKQRLLLALLLVEADRDVPRDLLVDELWLGNPPSSWPTTLQTYVYQLRKHTLPGSPGRIRTTRSGYRLEIDRSLLDWCEFERRAGEADRSAFARPVVADAYREALALWRGTALADVDHSPRVQAVAERLERLRRAARAAQLTASYRSGRLVDVIADARSVLMDDPLNETAHVCLIRSLAGRGRRHDAARHLHRFRKRLLSEAGVASATVVETAYAEAAREPV